MTRRKSTENNSPVHQNPRRWTWMIASMAVVLTAVLVGRQFMGAAEAEAQTAPKADANVKPASATKPYKPPQHDVMAIVNGADISRRDLERACAERYGEEVLEAMVNKKLIQHHCQKRGIAITQQEVEDELDRMAQNFKLTRELLTNLLEDKTGVTEEQYKRDILWPTLALRKLVAADMVVTEEELRKDYESKYGESVRVRIIVVANGQKAQDLHKQLLANPDDFARLALSDSIDVNSAPIGGLIQPIRRFVGDPGIEQAAFALKPGQISQIIPIGDQFAILKCEGRNPPREVDFNSVRTMLEESIRDEKLRKVANDKFKEFQDAASIQNVFNDPQLSQRMPGVVALVNGDKVTLEELSKESMLRHGPEVLNVEIGHKLLEQALKRAGKTVSQEDLNAEIAHAAKLAGVVDEQGRPDIQRWVKQTTEEQDISYKLYVRDSVWPSAALKKLTAGQVQVTQEDLKKSYDANYGVRVRCRAIVLANMRRAQEVWEKARANPSMDYFGDLAAEYSIEPTSKALRGEVPPIRLHGGQPQLEQVAFELTENDPPRIVQLGDKFVVLKYEGRTEPKKIELEAVRDILLQDIMEKKIRVAMGKRYDEIYRNARVDNYLAGTTQAPVPDEVRQQRAGTMPRRDTAVQPASAQRR